eukprot:gnl/Spiro4/29410_TR14404_c0_g1_i1.p1 gnl/Spiro4/29410_TR14404_c0_g1~~gnl/Spiro4/29410_TR14404_c0_g1_i1.p1  ORF type:complete len:430 (+),score=79.24 gnl/Spiro4/29410_TR14404_c0_g1_i1:47-1336(+)
MKPKKKKKQQSSTSSSSTRPKATKRRGPPDQTTHELAELTAEHGETTVSRRAESTAVVETEAEKRNRELEMHLNEMGDDELLGLYRQVLRQKAAQRTVLGLPPRLLRDALVFLCVAAVVVFYYNFDSMRTFTVVKIDFASLPSPVPCPNSTLNGVEETIVLLTTLPRQDWDAENANFARLCAAWGGFVHVGLALRPAEQAQFRPGAGDSAPYMRLRRHWKNCPKASFHFMSLSSEIVPTQTELRNEMLRRVGGDYAFVVDHNVTFSSNLYQALYARRLDIWKPQFGGNNINVLAVPIVDVPETVADKEALNLWIVGKNTHKLFPPRWLAARAAYHDPSLNSEWPSRWGVMLAAARLSAPHRHTGDSTIMTVIHDAFLRRASPPDPLVTIATLPLPTFRGEGELAFSMRPPFDNPPPAASAHEFTHVPST